MECFLFQALFSYISPHSHHLLHNEIKHMKIKTLIIASMCLSTSAYAGGYRVALQGQTALGMGHAGVAMTENAEVVFFNPASMSLLTADTSSAIGLTLINSKTKYQSPISQAASETESPIGTPFYIYYTKKYNSNIALGFAMYTPYGNSVTWPKDWPGSHLVNNISLKTIYAQPTISYKVNNKISVGFGPTLVNGYVELNRNLSSTLADENGNRSNVTLKATGVTAWGYNVGVLAKPVKPLSIGINYRSRVDLKARNRTADFENLPSSMQNVYTDTTFDADLVLPAELTLGIAYNIGSRTTVALDINRSFWSAYKSLDVSFDNGLPTSRGPRNYQDANVYRLGVQHKLNNTITLRAGTYYDQTPIQDGYQAPETPRNNSLGVTAGVGYQLNKHMAVDVSFLYLHFTEFNGRYDYVGHDDDPTTQDKSFGGEYLSTVTSIGFGFNYKY